MLHNIDPLLWAKGPGGPRPIAYNYTPGPMALEHYVLLLGLRPNSYLLYHWACGPVIGLYYVVILLPGFTSIMGLLAHNNGPYGPFM